METEGSTEISIERCTKYDRSSLVMHDQNIEGMDIEHLVGHLSGGPYHLRNGMLTRQSSST